MHSWSRRALLTAAAALLLAPAAAAQPPKLRSMTVTVDLTEAPRKLLKARLVIPTQPGPLRLCYPKWIPGEHGPTGPITDLAGLKVTARGSTLPWRREDTDMYAFWVTVP